MCNSRFCFTLLVIISLILVIGCSGGSNPVAPIGALDSQSVSYNSFPVGVSDLDADGNPLAGYGALGLFEIHLDCESLTGDIQSLRKASLPDVLEVVDITNFLQVAPCTDCARIGAISADTDGNIVLSMGIKHPFDAGNPMEPISGKNRGDLHIFNVEGLVVVDSDVTVDFAGIKEQVADFDMINADGYSPYLDDALDGIYPTTATIHPYKLHFDDYSAGNFDGGNLMGFESVTDPPPSGNLVMAMGCDYDYQDYIFNLASGETIRFMFAIGCTYAVSADSKSQRFMPEYRVPQHLKKAACEVAVRIVDNQFEPGNPLSTADLAIDVVDVNHGVAAGDALNEMAHDSSVSGISIEIPGVLFGVTDVTLTNTGGTGHDSTDPLTYEITIQNEAAAAGSGYRGLVKVLDAYPSGSNTFLPLGDSDGIERVEPNQNPLDGLFAIDEFATYQVFYIDASGLFNNPPVADLQPDPIIIHQGNSVNFDGSASYDTDGTIMLYEFDFD